jgi:hypothetical protein
MFFFGQFFNVAKVVIVHRKEDLAKFGYKINLKVDIFKHRSIFEPCIEI